MGDLATDTAVRAAGGDGGTDSGEGRFEATLSPDWEIWGPMGGYVAATALRAVGALAGPGERPATFSCHYLSVARFGTVDLHVTTRRRGRTARSQRVEVTQEGKPILDATAWVVGPNEGLEHDETVPPDVPGPDELPGIEELRPDDDPGPPFPFWNNLEGRPIDWEPVWPPEGPRPARWQQWLRFRPTASYDDPWADAARSVVLIDLPSWPSAHRPHAWREPPFTAPTLDLNVAFHRPTAGVDWLLCDGEAPVSTGGLFGWTARVWSPGGNLHASGGGQCLYRRHA
jgi:acyl-CoA thioesterase-2